MNPIDFKVLERGWLSSNNIVFFKGEQCAIVDTGYVAHAQQTLNLVQSTLDGRPLDLIVNTHLHSDHCGGNAVLQNHFRQSVTLIPPGHAHDVASWNEQALSFAPTGQLCDRFTHNSLLMPGSTIDLGLLEWEIHAAPGHDPESVILFEPSSRTLISADALWESGFGVVFPELDRSDAFNDVALTLDLIERLAPTCIIPGHGRVFYDLPKALHEARTRLDKFVQDPTRHARYGGKVLIKYKLLEWQCRPVIDLLSWVNDTSYFSTIHRRFFAHTAYSDWINSLIKDLIRSGAASERDGLIFNQD